MGHSLGSIIVQGEAGNYGDVDALVTTGFSSSLNYSNAFFELDAREHLATSDPRFAESDLDPLYVTS